MNKLFITSVLASLCAFSISSSQQSQTKKRNQTPSPETPLSASPGAPTHTTVVQQIPESAHSTALQTNGTKSVHIKTAKPSAPSVDAPQKQSYGEIVDTIFTKLADNWWGHASNVTSDIVAGTITKDADTNGLHRIDRAIDEHVAKDDQAGLMELIQACTDSNILIPVAHIKKSEGYIHDLQNKLKNTLILLNAMQNLHIDIMKSSLETTSDDDSGTITVKPTQEEKDKEQ